MAASAEGCVLTINGTKTVQPARCDDVLVGEVWLCSGQSNMDSRWRGPGNTPSPAWNHEAEEVAGLRATADSHVHGRNGARTYRPQSTVAGVWRVCTPETVREFSAVGYFFARDLQKELRVPVGIITKRMARARRRRGSGAKQSQPIRSSSPCWTSLTRR